MSLKKAPYGTWVSPITSDAIAKPSGEIDELVVDQVTGRVFYLEKRSAEAGRSVLIDAQTKQDVVGKEWNVRTGVHEYGGAPAAVRDGVAFFSHYTDSRVYMVKPGATPEAVTPDNPNQRFADLNFHPSHSHLLVAIVEDHTHPEPPRVITSLCIIDTNARTVSVIVSGSDFYSHPRFSPDGTRLAFQSWEHPDMPWEGSRISVAPFSVDSNGSFHVGDSTILAGKSGEISACFPAWAPNGALFFTSDEGGPRFQNPWVSTDGQTARPALKEPLSQEFGFPQWVLGYTYTTVLDDEGKHVLFAATKDGRSVLHLVDYTAGTSTELDSLYVDITYLRRIGHGRAVFLGKTTTGDGDIVVLSVDPNTGKHAFTVIPTGGSHEDDTLPPGMISQPMPLTLDVPGGGKCYAVLYKPTNTDYEGSSNPEEKPPCVVSAHGGPTGLERQFFSITKQFFTSRGWAWVDINYGGSAGYGRKYTERLRGQWGVVDVQDCISGVEALGSSAHALIDPKRVVIRGASAGGFTVLASLCDVNKAGMWAAGASLFGISDLRMLAGDTHKFESRYMEKLVGGTLAEIPKVYEERSPVSNAAHIKAPMLILQGSLDPVVPPGQAETIVKTIKERGGRVEYTLFEGESHGWRKSETIKKAIELELVFYEDVLGLKRQ